MEKVSIKELSRGRSYLRETGGNIRLAQPGTPRIWGLLKSMIVLKTQVVVEESLPNFREAARLPVGWPSALEENGG